MEALIREGKRTLLSLIHSVQARVDAHRVNALLENYDPSIVENVPPKKVKTICFLLTRMVRYVGGQTSVLRLGTELSKQGYHVYYAVYKSQSKEEMEYVAKCNLPGVQGTFLTAASFRKFNEKKYPDVVVATGWDTVSHIKKLGSYKMYYVQDYEPYFYTFGEMFLMAKKTYEQGLHMVSFGAWNKQMIEHECKPVSAIDVVDFPYERAEYPFKERDFDSYPQKKEIVIAVYLKYYGKRLPCVVQYMIEKVSKMLQKDGIKLTAKYYGEAKTFKVRGGENIGMLNKQELRALYEEVDFGLVASMTNICTVPYEMLATGLPLIEFSEGTFEYFFPKNCATLVEMSAEDLYHKLKSVILTPEVLREQQKNAQEYLNTLSWEKTGKQFGEILERL